MEMISSDFSVAVESPVLTPVIHDELVHATRSQRGAHGLGDNLAGINVTDKLRDPLRSICALLQQDNWGWLEKEHKPGSILQSQEPVDKLELRPCTAQQADVMKPDQTLQAP